MAPPLNHLDTAPPLLSRRSFLGDVGGLGSIALAWMLHQDGAFAAEDGAAQSAPGAHFPAKAKRVVQIFCTGGVSHVDTFDYKPELEKRHGQQLTGKGKIDTFFGAPGRLMKSPFAFQRHGQSGLWCSDLLPHLATCVDDITFLYSAVAESPNHTPATFQMNTGFTMNGFPCLGAWLSYGLGTENQDLPAFVVLPDARGLPAGGAINWTSGFLPAVHQGVAFRTKGEPIPFLDTPAEIGPRRRQASGRLLRSLDEDFARRNPGSTALAARIRAYELVAVMQSSVPQAVDLSEETAATKKLYGADDPSTQGFGRNCLLARRLLEHGVRFVQLYNGGAFGAPRINWDAHEDVLSNHRKQAAVMDKPVAGLLKDLKQRGLLKDTLVLWTTEFGRTPFTQGIGATGRDHHQHVYTNWMAGAGLKPGFGYGQSDEVGYKPAADPVTVYDFHATVLHLLGLDHKQLTFYHNGIRRRLTNVAGVVIDDLLA